MDEQKEMNIVCDKYRLSFNSDNRVLHLHEGDILRLNVKVEEYKTWEKLYEDIVDNAETSWVLKHRGVVMNFCSAVFIMKDAVLVKEIDSNLCLMLNSEDRTVAFYSNPLRYMKTIDNLSADWIAQLTSRCDFGEAFSNIVSYVRECKSIIKGKDLARWVYEIDESSCPVEDLRSYGEIKEKIELYPNGLIGGENVYIFYYPLSTLKLEQLKTSGILYSNSFREKNICSIEDADTIFIDSVATRSTHQREGKASYNLREMIRTIKNDYPNIKNFIMYTKNESVYNLSEKLEFTTVTKLYNIKVRLLEV